MTRINANLNPKFLTDQHLLAEYNETGMLFSSLRRTLKSKNGLDLNKISKKFTLNSGHVMFFYDKLIFIQNRYEKLKEELRNRAFQLDENRKIFKDKEFPKELYNDWDGDDVYSIPIITERIKIRIAQKPKFYKYYRKQIDEKFIERMYG